MNTELKEFAELHRQNNQNRKRELKALGVFFWLMLVFLFGLIRGKTLGAKDADKQWQTGVVVRVVTVVFVPSPSTNVVLSLCTNNVLRGRP